MQSLPRNHRRGITALEVVITILILLMLATLFLPWANTGHRASRRSMCRNNLKQIGLALHNYHEDFNTFPPGWIANRQAEAVNPAEGYGWMVQLLDSFEVSVSEKEFAFQGTLASPANTELVKQELSWLHCASDPANALATSKTFPEIGTTNYVGMYGVGLPSALHEEGACQGVFGSNSCIRIPDIVDGTTNVLMVGERRLVRGGMDWPADKAEGSFNSYWAGIPNLKTDSPLCVVGTTMTGEPALSGDGNGLNSTGHINALKRPDEFPSAKPLPINQAVDGTLLPTTTESPTVFGKLSGKEERTFGTSVTAGFSSWHIGGTQFLLCDGSVRFISENIDPETLVNLSRRFDGLTAVPF